MPLRLLTKEQLPLPDLESLTDELDAICVDALGETITYIRAGRAPLRFKAHVDYADATKDIGAGQMIEQDMTLAITKLSLPFEPNRHDRIMLSKRPGRAYFPASVANDSSGTHWVIVPKMVK
jgi:hypothetical protein